MSAGGSTTHGSDWFQPGIYSVWLYDRMEGETEDDPLTGDPIFIVVYEWEVEGLRGVHLVGAWGSLLDLNDPENAKDSDYGRLRGEVVEPSDMQSLGFVQLIQNGNMHRIGVMPAIGEFEKPPGYFADNEQRGESHE